jgi:hypothetical protein
MLGFNFSLFVRHSQGLVLFVSHLGQYGLSRYVFDVLGVLAGGWINLSMLCLLTYYINA